MAVRSENAFPGLLGYLADREMLLVFDSCEHVIEITAALAEGIFKAAPGVRILATSRESLLAEGEAVARLAPLALPTVAAELTAAEALTFPAIQLFIERAAACLDDFELTDADAPIVAAICRRLDGIPLAIELAAGRIDAFGVRGVADRLDDRFRLLTRGRRTALRRHQTLAATLNWSYELLTESQGVIFRRLGVFAGWFTSESAAAIVSDETLTGSEVVNGIADLVAKSLVAADVEGPTAYYRLLDTTRAYAFEKFVASGESGSVLRRHAGYYRDLFQKAETEWENRPTKDWLSDYAPQIDNVRAALNWAFSSVGDTAVGVALTIAAAPLWFQLSLIDECRERVEQALAAIESGGPRGDIFEMKLRAARGWSLMYTAGPARESGADWAIAYKLAQDLGETDYCLRSLWGLWAGRINNGEFATARELADRFSRLAQESADPTDRDIGDRMMGAALHFLGDQPGARRRIERMLSRYVAPLHRSHVVRYQFDQRVTAKITLARVLWLQGFAEQAMRAVESSVDEALSLGHTLSLCNALAQAACPVALLSGDLERAERFTAMLLNQTNQHALDIWRVYGNCYRGQILIKRGDADAGLPLVNAAVEELRGARFIQYYTAFLIALAEGLVNCGRVTEALAAIDEALLQSERNNERWCVAEIIHVKGKIIRRMDRADASATAEQNFLVSLKWAQRQQALSWELRTAISLARLQRDQTRTEEAYSLLAPLFGRFTEGFDTADLKSAKALLAELA